MFRILVSKIAFLELYNQCQRKPPSRFPSPMINTDDNRKKCCKQETTTKIINITNKKMYKNKHFLRQIDESQKARPNITSHVIKTINFFFNLSSLMLFTTLTHTIFELAAIVCGFWHLRVSKTYFFVCLCIYLFLEYIYNLWWHMFRYKHILAH